MEQILEVLRNLGAKTSCLPESDALSLISPALECLQKIESELSIQNDKLSSRIHSMTMEMEEIMREYGVVYVPFGSNTNCSCVQCQSILVNQLEHDMSSYLRPVQMAVIIKEQYEACLRSIKEHSLTMERSDERVSQFLNSLGIALSQVKNNHSIPYLDKTDQIIALTDRMSNEMERVIVEKERCLEEIGKVAIQLGMPSLDLATLSLDQMESQLAALQDQLAHRRSQLASSISTVQRLWEIMAVPVSDQFALDPLDFGPAQYERIETEKRRLFDLQKERFKAMLEEQERELEGLWDEIEVEKKERQSVRDAMRLLPAVETLEQQSALIAKLTPIAELHATIRQKIDKRTELIQRMQEFEATASDPNRLFGSSFRLNQEERFRKAAYPTLVKLEATLLEMLAGFKDQYGLELVYRGVVVKEAIEHEKENRILNDTLFCIKDAAKEKEKPPVVCRPPVTANKRR